MNLRLLRGGELTALAGLLTLAIALPLDWFDDRSGLGSLGVAALVPALAAIVVAAWLVLTTARRGPQVHALAAASVGILLGALALAALLIRTGWSQPGDDDAATSVRAAAYVGLAGAALIAAGCWRTLADERTDAPESAFTPPPPRPAPPAGPQPGPAIQD